MIDLALILNNDQPDTNTARKMRWAWRWRDTFGTYPDFGPTVVRQCCICNKPVWIHPRNTTNPLKLTCSTDCDITLDELRRDNHWS